mmetsp:Transcript_26282/g.84583  ORF Transcript_26282/g.84583 Transcript_26282/m.84583 type:complete len:782 (+) Transcript_26282:185-2530(+)
MNEALPISESLDAPPAKLRRREVGAGVPDVGGARAFGTPGGEAGQSPASRSQRPLANLGRGGEDSAPPSKRPGSGKGSTRTRGPRKRTRARGVWAASEGTTSTARRDKKNRRERHRRQQVALKFGELADLLERIRRDVKMGELGPSVAALLASLPRGSGEGQADGAPGGLRDAGAGMECEEEGGADGYGDEDGDGDENSDSGGGSRSTHPALSVAVPRSGSSASAAATQHAHQVDVLTEAAQVLRFLLTRKSVLETELGDLRDQVTSLRSLRARGCEADGQQDCGAVDGAETLGEGSEIPWDEKDALEAAAAAVAGSVTAPWTQAHATAHQAHPQRQQRQQRQHERRTRSQAAPVAQPVPHTRSVASAATASAPGSATSDSGLHAAFARATSDSSTPGSALSRDHGVEVEEAAAAAAADGSARAARDALLRRLMEQQASAMREHARTMSASGAAAAGLPPAAAGGGAQWWPPLQQQQQATHAHAHNGVAAAAAGPVEAARRGSSGLARPPPPRRSGVFAADMSIPDGAVISAARRAVADASASASASATSSMGGPSSPPSPASGPLGPAQWAQLRGQSVPPSRASLSSSAMAGAEGEPLQSRSSDVERATEAAARALQALEGRGMSMAGMESLARTRTRSRRSRASSRTSRNPALMQLPQLQLGVFGKLEGGEVDDDAAFMATLSSALTVPSPLTGTPSAMLDAHAKRGVSGVGGRGGQLAELQQLFGTYAMPAAPPRGISIGSLPGAAVGLPEVGRDGESARVSDRDDPFEDDLDDAFLA